MEVHKCKDCNKIKLRAEEHLFGYTPCRNCEQIDKTDEHKCYMQPKKPKACPENYIFFDYEAEQDTGVHNPNLIVAH
jgi:hypothetical protein